jgi:hypothetical protein
MGERNVGTIVGLVSDGNVSFQQEVHVDCWLTLSADGSARRRIHWLKHRREEIVFFGRETPKEGVVSHQ